MRAATIAGGAAAAQAAGMFDSWGWRRLLQVSALAVRGHAETMHGTLTVH
ncbi:MAG TPA: hypothetical protein VG245_07750 [Candidatus Dormibacteraeota bacterium]|jgi:hypothetical protein|nr:hypothetical protein [Candidatus Dormibacteraeota bacterium]